MNYPNYKFKTNRFKTPGGNINYIDEGENSSSPVVMVHGNPSWSFYFRNVVKALSANYRCIVPDHIGMGLSDRPNDSQYNYTLKQRINDLENLLDHLNITENITLIVHDWGGMIGMGYATRHPERIKRLVITNTAAFKLPTTKKLPWQLIACRTPILGPLLVRGLNGFCKYAVKHCVKRNTMSKELSKAYLKPHDSWKNRLAVLRFVEDIPLNTKHPTYKTVADIDSKIQQFDKLPMTIFWGLKDFVFDIHFLDEWTKRFPNAKVHRYDDAGHYILEDAGQEIIPLIEQFLAEYPITSD